MNVDEIIKYKEWVYLSADEKQQIQELAATETEFSLVKRIMLQSAIREESIPNISQKVQDHLKEQLFEKKPFKMKMGWLAAAAVAAIMIALFFIMNNSPEKSNPIVKTNEQKAVEQVKAPDQGMVEPVMKDTIMVKPSAQEKVTVKLKEKNSDNNNIDTVKINTQKYDRYISATVESDSSLLTFITKVY